jgi:hypothetical protein
MNRNRIFLGIAIVVGLGAIVSVLLAQYSRSCACKPPDKSATKPIDWVQQSLSQGSRDDFITSWVESLS